RPATEFSGTGAAGMNADHTMRRRTRRGRGTGGRLGRGPGRTKDRRGPARRPRGDRHEHQRPIVRRRSRQPRLAGVPDPARAGPFRAARGARAGGPALDRARRRPADRPGGARTVAAHRGPADGDLGGGAAAAAHRSPEVEAGDQDGTQRATVLSAADVRLARFGDEVEIEVIRRGGRTGLRILDPSAPRLTGFTGVPTYPYDPELVVTGIWTARPAMVTVGAALPWLEHELPSPGVATVEIGD